MAKRLTIILMLGLATSALFLATVEGLRANRDIREEFSNLGNQNALVGAEVTRYVIEKAIDNGLFDLDAVFDSRYEPIDGAGPTRYRTAYDYFFDRNVQKVLDAFLENDRIYYCYVVNRDGYVPTSTDKKQSKTKLETARLPQTEAILSGEIHFHNVKDEDSYQFLEFHAPITVYGQPWGEFRVGIPVAMVNNAVRDDIVITLLTTVFFSMMVIGLMFYLIRRNLRPLGQLTRATEQMTAGNLSARCGHRSRDELGILSQSFNDMAEKIAEAHEHLEQQVRQRTTELEHTNQNLQVEIAEHGKTVENLTVTLNSIGDAVITVDTEGRVTRMNPVAEQLTGWCLSDAVERPLEEVFNIVHERDESKVENPVRKVLQEGRIIGLANHTVLISKDGNRYPIGDSGSPIRDNDGRIIGAVLVFRDVTTERLARRTLEEAKEELERQIQIRAAELVQTNAQLQQEVEEHQRAEEAAKQIRLQQEAILNNIPDMAWLKDKDGRYIAANEPFSQACGRQPADLIGKTDVGLWPEELTQRYQTDDQEVIRTNRRKRIEEPLVGHDGQKIWLETIKTPVVNDRNEVIGTTGIARNISEQKLAHDRIQKMNQLQAELLKPGTMSEKLKKITDGLVRVFGADFGRIWVIQPGDRCEAGCPHAKVTEGPHICRHRKKCLHLKASSGRYTHIDGEGHRRVPFGCYKIGRVAAEQDCKFLTNNVTTDPRVHNNEWAKELGLVSFAGYKIGSPTGDTLGVMALFAKHPISSEEDILLENLGHTVAQVIQSAQADEALRESEEQLRTLTDSIQDAIISIAEQGLVSFWNPAAEKMFGYTVAEVMGKNVHDLLAPSRFMEAHKRAFPLFQKTGQGAAVGKTVELAARRKNGEEFPIEVSLSAMQSGNVWHATAVIRDITGRKRAEEGIVLANTQKQAILDAASEVSIICTDKQGLITVFNRGAEKMLGYSAEEIIGKQTPVIIHLESEVQTRSRELSSQLGRPICGFDVFVEIPRLKGSELREWTYIRKDKSRVQVTLVVTPVYDHARQITGYLGVAQDITARKRLEQELLQAQKLESVGQLAAGIAHEINTPIQFVGDNIRFLSDSVKSLLELIGGYRDIVTHVNSPNKGKITSQIQEMEDRVDLTFLKEESPKAVEQSLEGVQRVSKIVRAMKEFSHPGAKEKTPIDLNRAIETTITVARNEWKYVADMETNFDPTLPLVPCLPGEFNQVILNMIVNAAHAIGDKVKGQTGTKGTISIATQKIKNWAEIRISDTGTGIPEEAKPKIFDPFFTTKEVGKGTGQGLTIARSVITDKHGGSITFETKANEGTTFIIRLPLTDAVTAKERV